MAGENLDIHPDDLAMYAAQEAPPQSGSEVEEKPPATAEEVEEEEDIEEEAEETPYGLNMHCIQPNLWIGDWTASQQVDVLKELGIKHIIAASEFCRGRSPPRHPRRPDRVCILLSARQLQSPRGVCVCAC